MLYLGCHLSASKGFMAMGRQAKSIGANTFQFFTRNPRGGKAKELDEADAAAFVAFARENGFGPIVAHAPYTLNACSADESIRTFARETFADDLRRLEYVPGNYYNFHPGSHVGQGVDAGIGYIVEMLDAVLTPDMRTTVLLETMAGKGSEVGARFEELRAIIDRVRLPEKLGVCLDTCHIFDGGYDIRENADAVMAEFDRVIGFDRLKAVHLNDSKFGLASHKDRHEKIGQGALGLEAMAAFMRRPEIRELPMELETPNEIDGYRDEIALLRETLGETL